jgi:hypothetical protein
MARFYKAPQWYPKQGFKVFLSGSIDMGKAEDWQTKLSAALDDQDIMILNPRRDDWDDTWEQSLNDERFVEQVQWELEAMEAADVIAVHFTKDSFSPITLLELGLHATTEWNMLSSKQVVYCEEGFYRKGNVDVVCRYYGIDQEDNFEDFVGVIRMRCPPRTHFIKTQNDILQP